MTDADGQAAEFGAICNSTPFQLLPTGRDRPTPYLLYDRELLYAIPPTKPRSTERFLAFTLAAFQPKHYTPPENGDDVRHNYISNYQFKSAR